MREYVSLNDKWAFTKEKQDIIPTEIPESWYLVNLPHTWNSIDGQDGGNDYFRGECLYAKKFSKSYLPKAEKYYLEIKGANSVGKVYLNGKHLATHKGGYSKWRVELTDELMEENLLIISVDNSAAEDVYPEMADFTFYGGLYRDVRIICVGKSHFELEYFGTSGIKVTPKVEKESAYAEVEVFVKNRKDSQKICYTIFDADGQSIASIYTSETKVIMNIENVHLWQGREDPYLYVAKAELCEGETVIDSVSTRFGCRTFSVDPEKGFFLNGREYPLRGVSRHQDRWRIGNALLPEHHREDIDLILDVGANTVRLAHYQHDEYFYSLCDEKGLVVWAEIPYISKHKSSGNENTFEQMRELILQNYNNPSIVFWGLSNEITMNGAEDSDLIENHKRLNDLCHSLDKTRLTAVAAVTTCPMGAEYLKIPDVVAYNHYFGWYGGDVSENGKWFDKFHKENPNIPIGCSEYGAEALNWHTSEPTQGDYTEEYQAYYHEEMIKQLFSRKYLFATYVWNMFDFGADARAEGGEHGKNHKGLVTFDRKYKKDSFFAYKAWLSDEPFVHICGKRYVERVEKVTRVTVYSNLPEVELYLNGKSLGKQYSKEHFFKFDVPNSGVGELLACAGNCRDEAKIKKVEAFNEKYRLQDFGAVLNWYDIDSPKGYLSLNDKISDIQKTEEGEELLVELFQKIMPHGVGFAGFEISEDMHRMLEGFTLIRLFGMFGSMLGVKVEKDELLSINKKLNKIKKN